MQSEHPENPHNPPVYVARPRPYRTRRALWGIGALAMSPDAVPEGPRRRGLVRAATVTGVMGLAWASTASGAPPTHRGPSFDHIGLPSVEADEDAVGLSSPLPGRWQQTRDDASTGDGKLAATEDAPAASPNIPGQKARKREHASQTTARREMKPDEDQARTKGSEAERATTAAASADDRSAGAAAEDPKGRVQKADTTAEDAGTRADVKGAGKGTTEKEAGRKPEERAAAASTSRGAPTARKAAPVRAAQQAKDVSAAPDPDAWRTNVVANHEGVEFVQMSDETVLVGFHEAALPGAKALTPAAKPDTDHGRGGVTSTDARDPLRTMILPTRARTTGAASAMDVVIPEREAVFAPVTGTVTELDHYQLYGTHPDNRLVIVPDARPDLRVVILHVEGLKVDVGDKVTAGRTKIAVGANPFTFESQIDRFARPLMDAGAQTPHVHIELR